MNTNMLLLAYYHPFKFMEKREKQGPNIKTSFIDPK